MRSTRATSLLAGLLGLALATTLGGCLVADTSGPPSNGFRGDTSYGGTGYGGGYGGTGGSTDSRACAGGTTSNFKVAWTIQDANGNASTCDGVAAVEMDLDLLNVATNVDYHGVYACSDLMGTSCELPAGRYTVAMRLRDAQGTLLSEAIAPGTYSITTGQTTDLGNHEFASSQGTSGAGTGQAIKLAWSIERAGTTTIITCADAGAATVELDVGTQQFPFPCGDGSGQTPSLTVGTYPTTIRLLDAQGTALSVTPTMDVAVPAALLLDLHTVIFDVI